MGLLSPISETTRGLKTYMKGASWLKSHPKHLFLVFLPMVIGIFLFIAAWQGFFSYEDVILDWVLFARPESWWGISLYFIVKVFVYLAILLLGVAGCVLFVNILSSPVYEYVSLAVEETVTGRPAPELNIMESLKLMGEEIKKVLFIMAISIALLLIPGLNVLSIVVTAFLVGWDFYDYPLARRGWSFKQRMDFVKQDLFAVMGLGFWMVIPFVQIITMPLAVAGGTMLSVTALENMKND